MVTASTDKGRIGAAKVSRLYFHWYACLSFRHSGASAFSRSSAASPSRMVTGDRRISRLEAIALQKLLLPVTSTSETQPRAFVEPSATQAHDIVVPAQAELEVYKGDTGGVVIRAIDSSPGGEDQTIVIRPENVDVVVAALLRVKAEVTS